jgi:hypothetical protein
MKIVCWGDYAFPVPDKAKWIAMDADGTWFWFESEPVRGYTNWWPTSNENWESFSLYASPPELGGWDTQRYWLEDM